MTRHERVQSGGITRMKTRRAGRFLRRALVTVAAMLAATVAWSASVCAEDYPGAALGLEPTLRDCPDIPPSEYWANSIVFPDDPFIVQGSSSELPGWVKFTMLVCDMPFTPDTPVYFQDSHEYPYHYEFCTELLWPIFGGMNHEAFENATLYNEGRLGFLGAVLVPPQVGWPSEPVALEYGIEFVGLDPLPKETVRDMFYAVMSGVNADPEVQAFYFPTYHQQEQAELDSDWFAAQDPPIIISSSARWSTQNVIYSEGWALGELKYFDGDDIEDAYIQGLLTPWDILLTDGVPSEVPFVAGILTLSPSTPNSHVTILANTYGIPFVYLAFEEDAVLAQQLVGTRIALRAYDTWGNVELRLIDAESLTGQQVLEILELKQPPDLNIQPMAPYGAYSAPTTPMMPSDIQYFGGKAANFGMIRRAIPDNSPVATAFSFDLWNEFMDQTMGSGFALRGEIAAILANYPTWPPADMGALADDLDDIRDMIKDDTVFNPTLEQAVFDTLQDPQYGFDPFLKIRFRSSTNVEDSEFFTGAGLYDSYSGCLQDDLDGDEVGPSWCDPEKPSERGVFRAIRKVFASFYNDNAFLERLRHGVNEEDVGMAVLVHHSFPDEIELANGVGTLEVSGGYSANLTLVTQVGATSVTNPEGGAIAEQVDVYITDTWMSLMIIRYSNLLPWGETVLVYEDEYIELAEYLMLVADEFETATGKTEYVLDFEYKKMAPGGGALPAGGLVVKQVREIPQQSNEQTITPFLLKAPTEYVVHQGESGNVFGLHRLKSQLILESDNRWMTEKNLAEDFYADGFLMYLEACQFGTLSGPLATWPEASYSFEALPPYSGEATNGWVLADLLNPRSYELRTQYMDMLVAPSESPILIVRDFAYSVQVDYVFPVPTWTWEGSGLTTTDTVQLRIKDKEQSGDLLQERTIVPVNPGAVDNVVITTSFYWPPAPGMAAGYTAPLIRWVETIIEGVISEPIVLHGYYSQTYRPEHHNFSEHFLFEPRLDPGVSHEQLEELAARNIQMIHVLADRFSGEGEFTYYESDGTPCNPCGDDIERGDVNGDGFTNGLDVQSFVEEMLNPIGWTPSYCAADIDGSLAVDIDDVAPFVACVLDGGCP